MQRSIVLPCNIPSEKSVFLCIIAARLLICWLIRTNFVPDEYFQALEPAFHTVHGAGILTWEWSRAFCLRSYVGIMPFVGLYKLLHWLGLDEFSVLYVAPRLLQCVVTIIADFCLYRMARHFGGADYAAISTAVHLTSWGYAFCCCRTLANTTEASLLLVGAYLWLVPHGRRLNGRSAKVLGAAVASFSCHVRPTALLLWGPLAAHQLYISANPARLLIRDFLPVGIMLFQAFVLIDSFYYGQLVVAPYNFYWANVHQDMAALFGRHPWHWNFSNGLPTMLGLYAPLVAYGYTQYTRLPAQVRELAAVALLYVVGLSVLSTHQELRFLLPCLPIMHMVAAHALLSLFGVSRYPFANSGASSSSNGRINTNRSSQSAFVLHIKRGVFIACCVGHIVACSYLLTFHQAGTEAAMQLVAGDIASRRRDSTVTTSTTTHVLLAAPCYAFPGYAYIHSPADPVQLYMPPCQVGGPALFDENPLEHAKAMIASYQLNMIQELSKKKTKHPAYDFSTPNEGDLGGDSVAVPSVRDGNGLNNRKVIEEHECVAESAYVYLLTFDSYAEKLRPFLRQHMFEELYQVHHAHVPYDLDDPFPKMMVEVYRMKHPVGEGCKLSKD